MGTPHPSTVPSEGSLPPIHALPRLPTMSPTHDLPQPPAATSSRSSLGKLGQSMRKHDRDAAPCKRERERRMEPVPDLVRPPSLGMEGGAQAGDGDDGRRRSAHAGAHASALARAETEREQRRAE
ncbi:hypothetical protein BRADI_2g50186v3 [Brachypodium distachyon]|uniref:Uncharacterized protein n=1 Tax=Brachypodium distachyon TaxID=15368 RepID=A0A0Q3N030_BRADI|nr:hypothetical protein BRADI_2g50186v3 [Brachypodium distachyon]